MNISAYNLSVMIDSLLRLQAHDDVEIAEEAGDLYAQLKIKAWAWTTPRDMNGNHVFICGESGVEAIVFRHNFFSTDFFCDSLVLSEEMWHLYIFLEEMIDSRMDIEESEEREEDYLGYLWEESIIKELLA